MLKTILAIVIVVLIGGGIYEWQLKSDASASDAQQASRQTVTQQEPNKAPTGISASGSSDAALNADLNTLNTQVDSAQNDSASVDSSFNDAPVAQTE